MKDISFLKNNLISNKGLYDGDEIFENTLEAFKEAISHNLIINLKVRLTKDKKLIIYNDNNLERLLNLKDKISTITYDELLYLNKYHIPTLKEALELISGQVPIIINPKGRDDKYFLHKELSSYLDNYKGKFAIISSNPIIIRWYNKNKENYPVGEMLYKRRFQNQSLPKLLTNCNIKVDFKSIKLEYYDIIKIKELKEQSLILGYLADTKEIYDIYKDEVDNLYIEQLF